MPTKNRVNADADDRLEADATLTGMVERLCRLVEIRSVSREEGAIADYVAGELQLAGFVVQRDGNNVWTEIGDAPRPRLLLNSHLDTVPAAEGWTGDPWTVRRERRPGLVAERSGTSNTVRGEKQSGALHYGDGVERIFGLGANDAKGCVAALMQAATLARKRVAAGEALGGTVVLALTAEEEISGNGLSTILEKIGPIDAALVGEPTDLQPMIAQRGLLILKCTARGRTQHPANTPADTTENAIANAAADIARFREFDWGVGHPLLGRTHAHVTMINGGVARNVIPDRCEFWLDIRTTPEQSHADLVARLRDCLSSEIHVHSERLVSVHTDPRNPIVRAVLRALPDKQPAGSPAMSDMVFLAGIPAVKIGPGQSLRSHTPDEYILGSELSAGAAAYDRIIREYFAASVVKGQSTCAAGASASPDAGGGGARGEVDSTPNHCSQSSDTTATQLCSQSSGTSASSTKGSGTT